MLLTPPRGTARRRPPGADEGATVVEYVLLAGLVVVLVISAVTLLGGNVDALFDDLANHLGGGPAAGA